MSNKANAVLKYITVFICTVVLLTALLSLSALIPKKFINNNIKISSEYLCEGKLFGEVVSGIEGSKVDRYADSILLGIAYQYDSGHPLSSIMESSYYHDSFKNENDNLYIAVTQGKEANQQYMRYWHGSIAIVRPLLTVMNIRQIYIFNFIVMMLLLIVLTVLLVRNRAYIAAIGIVAGFVGTSSWFVTFSLEYTWMYLLMLVMSIILVLMINKQKASKLGFLFLIGGICTNYLDFLTTETMTLLIPLLLFVYFEVKNNKKTEYRQIIISCIKFSVLWLSGYAGMWIMKWILAAVMLNMNTLPYVTGHIEERLGGNIGISPFEYMTGAIINNVKCIFPFEYGVAGILAFIVVVIGILYISYVYHKKNINRELILTYTVIGIIPYIRYLILHNHSYLHYFFTYRAQMTTIMAVVFIVGSLVDWRYIFHGNARRN